MAHEQVRKIIRVGTSFAVTIPRAWLRYYKLDDKNKVLLVSNGIIKIKPIKPIFEKKVKNYG